MEEQALQLRGKKGSRVARLGLYANILLTSAKFAAGYFGRSRALIADALHSASDIVTDITVMLGFYFSSQPPDERHRWGHGKFETVASQIVGVFLIAAGIGIGYSAVESIIAFFEGQSIERPGLIAIFAAIISVLIKEFMYRVTARRAQELDSKALLANAWHHRSDALSSVGALIGVGCARFLGEGWRVLDPVTAVIVSIIVIITGGGILLDAMKELLETALPRDVEERIIRIICEVPGVCNPHKLRTRRVGHAYSIEVHIEVSPDMTVKDSHDIATDVQNVLEAEFGVDTFSIVHVEPHDE